VCEYVCEIEWVCGELVKRGECGHRGGGVNPLTRLGFVR